MEETLTDCLVRVREDLSQLKKVREYLDTNAETEKHCSITWRTIEAFNSILSVCSSQNSPETNALDTLLDSFYYLARNNRDDNVWEDFGFELGIICVKVLSIIERSDIFEILFCKLLLVISIVCEHNSNVWKAAARQILNVLINKKFCLPYLEAIVKLYMCILKNIDSSALGEFTSQNLHLLKTLSKLVQKVGDFEIQSSVIELVFLHLPKDTKLMSEFFSTAETNLLQPLNFKNFESDCRLYLNLVNKRGFDRKVYSICCHVLYLGGCFVEPPLGNNSLWVDANKESERVSIKWGDETGNRILLIQFSEIVKVQLENEKTEGNRCLTIQTKNLMVLHKDARNDDICLIVDNTEDVLDFIRFLGTTIGDRWKKKKLRDKGSKTMDCLVIDRNSSRLEVQDNAVISRERPDIDQILPDVFTLFENVNQTTLPTAKTSPRTTIQQQLSPNSFVESLNKHIGLESPELRHTYEDSIETIQLLQKTTPASHKLFRSPDKIFDIIEKKEPDFNFTFEENKENVPKTVIKTYSRETRKPKSSSILRDKQNLVIKISNTESQDYFRTDQNVFLKKKPCLPKIKRNTKATKALKNLKEGLGNIENVKIPNIQPNPHSIPSFQSKLKHSKQQMKPQIWINQKVNETKEENPQEKPKSIRTRRQEEQNRYENQFRTELKVKENQKQEKENWKEKQKCIEKKKFERQKGNMDVFEYQSETLDPPKKQSDRLKKMNKLEIELTKQAGNKPSLLDPNGYAYQRWCKPTTSERSNFWLKKLNAEQKTAKIEHDSVFDFSEGSDSISGKRKRKKRVVLSKRKSRTKQMTLQVKEILKKLPPKQKQKMSSREKHTKPTSVPEPVTASSDISKRSSSSESLNEQSANSEYESVSEDDAPPAVIKKLENSDSSANSWVKKKPKIVIPKNIILTLRRRLRKTEEKHRQRTEEIIETVSRATNHLLKYLQRREGERIVSYLKIAEAASEAFDEDIDDLNLRLKRIQRAILYYKAGCSLVDFCDSLADQMLKVRDAIKDFRGKKDNSMKIDRVHVRLRDLIKSEVEKTIGDEWATKRSRFLRCAAILGVNIRKFR